MPYLMHSSSHLYAFICQFVKCIYMANWYAFIHHLLMHLSGNYLMHIYSNCFMHLYNIFLHFYCKFVCISTATFYAFLQQYLMPLYSIFQCIYGNYLMHSYSNFYAFIWQFVYGFILHFLNAFMQQYVMLLHANFLNAFIRLYKPLRMLLQSK